MDRVLKVEPFLKHLGANGGIAEGQRCPIGNARKVIDEIGQASKSRAGSKSQRPARVERNLVAHNDARNVSTHFECLAAFDERVGILELIRGVASSLRKSRVHTQQGKACTGDAIDGCCLEQRIVQGLSSRSKLKIEATFRSTEFIDRRRRKRMGPG